MTSYIQRLLDGAAGTSGSVDMAEPPSFISQSPVYEADQRLGIFPDVTMGMEPPAFEHSPVTPEEHPAMRSNRQAPVEQTSAAQPMPANETPARPAADGRSTGETDQVSATAPDADSAAVPPGPAISSLQQLVESDPLPLDFNMRDLPALSPNLTAPPGKGDSRVSQPPFMQEGPVVTMPAQQPPQPQSWRQPVQQPLAESTAEPVAPSTPFLADMTGLEKRDSTTTAASPALSAASEDSVSTITIQNPNSPAEMIATSIMPVAHITTSPLATQQLQSPDVAQETREKEPVREIETRIEERIIEKPPEPTQPRTAAEASVIGPLRRPSLTSHWLRLRRF